MLLHTRFSFGLSARLHTIAALLHATRAGVSCSYWWDVVLLSPAFVRSVHLHFSRCFSSTLRVNMACNLTQAAQSIDLPIKRSGGRQQQPFRHRGCLLRSIYSRALCAKVTVYFKLSAWYFSCVVFFQYKSVPLYGVAVSCRFALPSFANFCKGRRRATNEVCQLFYCHNKKRCCSQDKTYFALGQAYFVWECSCTSCWWRMYLLTFLSIFSVLKNRKAQRFQVLTWLFGRKLCQ